MRLLVVIKDWEDTSHETLLVVIKDGDDTILGTLRNNP
jgi:hypothetical protein